MTAYKTPLTYLTEQLKSGGLTAIVLYWDSEAGGIVAEGTDTATGDQMKEMISEEGIGWVSWDKSIDGSLDGLAYCLDEYDVDNDHKEQADLKPRSS